MCNRFIFNIYTHSKIFKARPAGKTEKREVLHLYIKKKQDECTLLFQWSFKKRGLRVMRLGQFFFILKQFNCAIDRERNFDKLITEYLKILSLEKFKLYKQ